MSPQHQIKFCTNSADFAGRVHCYHVF